MTLVKNLSALIVVSAISSPLYAAQNGSNSPNGKPFVTINEQIIEVQGAVSSLEDQVDLLVAEADTMEARIIANEDAIDALEAATQSLSLLVQQNLTDISAIQSQIGALQAENETLTAQIAANSGDVADLEQELAVNTALLNQLQSAVLAIENDLITLDEGLTAQIENNSNLIAALQQEIDSINERLTFQENLANGICPNGSAVVDVLADGTAVCGNVGGSGPLGLVATYRYNPVNANQTIGAYASCPSGMVAIGGGWLGSPVGPGGDSISRDEPSGPAYNVIYKNNQNYSNAIRVQALCATGTVQIVP